MADAPKARNIVWPFGQFRPGRKRRVQPPRAPSSRRDEDDWKTLRDKPGVICEAGANFRMADHLPEITGSPCLRTRV
jgi:hypothetical protein